MAKIRCPMCSQINPPDAEECSYCGARLKPISPEEGVQPGDATGQPPEESEPEWLRSLRTDAPEDETGETPAEPTEGADMPDWISRIRSRSQSELESAAGEEQDQAPDWMKDFQGEDDCASKLSAWQPEGGQEPAASGDVLQWSDETGQEDEGTVGQSFGMTDFLSGLNASEEQPGQEPEAAPGADSSLWAAPEEEQNLPAAGTGGFGLTGFLSDLEEQSAQPEVTEQAPDWDQDQSSSLVEGLPEWLGEPSSDQADTLGEEETSLPDWLNTLNAKPGGTSEPAEEEDLGLPAWLDDLTAGSEAEAEPAGEAEGFAETGTPAESDAFTEPMASEEAFPSSEVADIEESGEETAVPSWLEGSEPLAMPEAESGETAVPDWLSSFAADDSGEQVQGSEQPEAESEAEDIPEWLGAAGPAGNSQASEPASTESGAPDWFSSFEDVSVDDTQPRHVPASQAEPTPSGEEAASPEPGEPEEEVPDWLREFESLPPTEASVPPLIETEAGAEVPPGLEGEQPFAVELPDWLSEEAAEPGEEAAEQPLEPAGEQLAQAELPDWVKDMRPIESIIPGEAQMADTDRRPEKTGPLAGMAGVLPAEEVAVRYTRPPVYSVKLHVTEKQRVQSSQLETILAQETQPLLIPPHGKRGQGLLLRALIAIILIGAMVLPRLMNMGPLAMPVLSPQEMHDMYQQIENGLAADAPVLVAVDYEPALSGEMRLASLPVIEHLMAKNTRIVVISTRPTGPALAQQLLLNAAENRPEYNLAQRTENLGYLPGDMISLLEFAHEPIYAAPAKLSGALAWGSPVLAGVQGIQDFASVVVLTDTAETGRAWVEQVQPLMGSVPLLMVTSAQAAPMMAPYVESNQVNGLVSGILGGVLYAQWAQQASPAMNYLASYQVGVLLVFALALFGGLISGGIALFRRDNKDED